MIAEFAPGHPYLSPCCGQPMTDAGAATLRCVLCQRVWTERPEPTKPERGAFAK